MKQGRIDETGRLTEPYYFTSRVFLNQRDIRELQLAKAAIAAGIQILCQKKGIRTEDIERVLIAGAFGNYLDPASACAIGMLPSVLLDRITSIGNAAGEGARIAAVNREQFERSKALAEKTEFVELALDLSLIHICIYEEETLPAFQSKLNELNLAVNQALTAYNEAENTYQMAFTSWSGDQSQENTEALSQAEADRSAAQVTYQNAQAAYEDYKTQTPAAPLLSDFTGAPDLVTDGTAADFSDSPSSDSPAVSVTADTSEIEAAIERASSDLAELQSELASQEAIAEADPNAVTEEEKERMEITNNLSELDQMTAQELVESAKKGIVADFKDVYKRQP